MEPEALGRLRHGIYMGLFLPFQLLSSSSFGSGGHDHDHGHGHRWLLSV